MILDLNCLKIALAVVVLTALSHSASGQIVLTDYETKQKSSAPNTRQVVASSDSVSHALIKKMSDQDTIYLSDTARRHVVIDSIRRSNAGIEHLMKLRECKTVINRWKED